MQRRTLFLILGGVFIALIVALTTGVLVWRLAKRTVADQISAIVTPQEKTIDVAALVTQVRELNRLETASMHVIHVGRVSQSYKLVPNALAGDEITFLAAGDVIAGIDLGRLQPQDVWRSPDGTINLRLPPAEVLVVRVDNSQSRVLTRDTGVLRRRDIDLETHARQHAEENIRTEAVNKGVLTMAATTGEKKLAGFLHTLGFEKVRFVNASGVPQQR
jgi:photosystem I reaction center subunit XII